MRATPEQIEELAELACDVACAVVTEDVLYAWRDSDMPEDDRAAWRDDVAGWIRGECPNADGLHHEYKAARIAVRFAARKMGIDVEGT